MSARSFLFALALLAAPGATQEPISLEAIAAGYFAAQTYCDAGRHGWRDDPAHPYTQEFTFSRCMRSDGRFRYVQRDERSGAQDANWSDGAKYFRYLGYGRRYQELALDDPYLSDRFRDRSQMFPVLVFEMFTSDPRDVGNAARRASYLRSYAPNATLSTAQQTVFERSDPDSRPQTGERLWVLNASRSIVRYERLRAGGVVRFTEITSRELDRPLADADLRYEVPLTARYSAMNNLPVFITGLIVAAGAAGVLAWTVLLARAAEAALRLRRLLWLFQLWALVAAAIALGLLAAFAPPGGHPPAIVFVYGLAFWCAVGFGMSAAFTVASYPVQLVIRARRRRRS